MNPAMAVSLSCFTFVLSLLIVSSDARNFTGSGNAPDVRKADRSSKQHPVEEISDVWRSDFDSTIHAVEDPDAVVSMVHETIRNSTARRSLGFLSCGTGNPIDDCWRCDPNWQRNRKRLADCGIGFGRNALGGRDGRYYIVTDSGDYDPVNPRPGTLRHAVIQDEPLWIVFKRDMVIILKQELIMNSFKTIDGRGVNVHIANLSAGGSHFRFNRSP